MSIGSLRQRTAITVALSLCTLSFLLPWSRVLAESNFSGCGGAVVAAQNVTYEAEVAELVNQRRAEEGLPPMKLVSALTDAARYHAADMTEDKYFSHPTQDRIDGNLTDVCSWSDRIKSFYTGYWTLGENIAWGYASPEEVMQGWMESPGHRGNILGSYTEIGVGYFNSRWVQDFGERKSEAPLIINREAIQTFIPEVTLYIHGSGQQMRLRNDDQNWSDWQSFQSEINWTLQNVSGERRVEIEVQRGSTTVIGTDTIVLNSTTSVTPTAVQPIATATAVQPIATATAVPPTATATPAQPTVTPTPFILPPDMDQSVYLPLVTR